MPYAKDYDPGKKIFALHIARSGDGKSAAAVSYPQPYHQLDFDGRFDGVWSALKPRGFIEDTAVSFDRLFPHDGYEPFQKIIDRLEMAKLTRNFPYKTIEIASLTTLTQALITSSHKLQKGKKIGTLRMSGPGDFGFEVTGMKQILSWLDTLPCNVVCSAHVIDKWGKEDPDSDEGKYAQNVVIGEKLCLRDQPGEVILSCFSNVFRFSREVVNGEMKYFVDFASDVAKNAFGIPPGKFDITGKPFYPFLQDLIKSIADGTFKKPEKTFRFG